MQTRRGWMIGVAVIMFVAATAWAQMDRGRKSAARADKPGKAVRAKIGEPAPDFKLKGIDGKTYQLADMADKVVVLEWFNTRCPFTRGAAELMSTTSARYVEKDVVWLAIDSTHLKHRDYQNAERLRAYAEENQLKYPILKDEDGKVARAYGAKTTPHIFIINKGTLVYAGAHDNGTGTRADGDRNYIAEALDAILAGKDVPAPKTKNRGCALKLKP